jgi:hypothetical protein
MLRTASERTGVPWRSCTAVEAHCFYHRLPERPLTLEIDGLCLRTDAPPFQAVPFVAAELDDGRFVRLYPRPVGPTEWQLATTGEKLVRIAAAVTSQAGDVTVATA